MMILRVVLNDYIITHISPPLGSPVTMENRNKTVVIDQSTLTALEPRAPSIQMHLRPCATSIIS